MDELTATGPSATLLSSVHPALPTPSGSSTPSLSCEYCGDIYESDAPHSKYCSDSCNSMAYKMRKREEGTCRICTKDARPGGIRCWEHYDQNLEDKRAYRQRLKEEGRCTRCGNEMCRGCNGDDPKWMR